ncbi:MAG: AmmeMemoRadiSam system protein A [Tissierellia bacterium]|nr:AmmeMemoRadiSam system protein A [Tissierellia bacterium]
MGKILSGYLFPHPPIIIDEIGKERRLAAIKTIEGSKKLAKDIREKEPTTIIIITPHGPLFRDAISISVDEELRGDFGDFGNRGLGFTFKNNVALVRNIIDKSIENDILIARIDKTMAKSYHVSHRLDHGTLVPLYFVNQEYSNYKLVHITYGLLPPEDLFKFGKIIQKAVLESDEKAVFIASGDLSHRLSKEGTYSYSPQGLVFDEKIVDLLESAEFDKIVSFDLALAEEAGQCALRSLMVLAGFLDGHKLEGEVLSYEGPFGVGYCNAKFKVVEKDEKENPYVALARKSLEHYVRYGKKLEIPKDLGEEFLNNRAGVFVSIEKKGMLRGCIGTIKPVRSNLAEEIIENAISAGTEDPRFRPVSKEELAELDYSVDVLQEPEPVSSIEELDPKRYGVIVSKGFRRGLLLPNLDGVNTVEDQIRIALMKAGISEDEDYKLERFEVTRHQQEG